MSEVDGMRKSRLFLVPNLYSMEGEMAKKRKLEKGYVGTWEGGVIRATSKGTPVFYIRKMIAGVKYDISTRCTSEGPAMEHLKRFQMAPEHYNPNGGAVELELTDSLLVEFEAWQREVKKNTRNHVAETLRWLRVWQKDLRGKCLRDLDVAEDVATKLPGLHVPGYRGKLSAIKVLFRFLRIRGIVRLSQDPTVDIPLPKTTQAKATRKVAFSKSEYDAILAHLSDPCKSALVLQGDTAWRFTELQRFARTGEIRTDPDGKQYVYMPMRKNKTQYSAQYISAKGLRAAEVLLKHGTVNSKHYRMQLAIASAQAGLKKPLSPGKVRHTGLSDSHARHRQTKAVLRDKAGHLTEKVIDNYIDAVSPRVPMLND